MGDDDDKGIPVFTTEFAYTQLRVDRSRTTISSRMRNSADGQCPVGKVDVKKRAGAVWSFAHEVRGTNIQEEA
ncbi:hypothetical protein SCP_0902560 [Sparassis crispa]|uniref:Uncharacterized protein n=1 Tax=Sparassis crispa TaxID=139825 RepID=A0A401GVX6_9APHY|nr:hypothetical protein SCP_0902560 [Sparassis crispa]GBE86377.1 hypothetical protein SCP_0902560 [Sparassis crispa]